MSTEQLYTTVLLNGDKTSFLTTLYYGDEYRMLICADDVLGKIQMNLKDNNNKTVFTTKGYGTIMWDFNVQSTQDFTIEIITQESTAGATFDKSGCVSVMVGFK